MKDQVIVPAARANAPVSAPAEPLQPAIAPRQRLIRRVGATLRQLLEFCRTERRWTLCMAVFIAVWTIELYLVQKVTLVYPNETGDRFAQWAPKIRFVLDLLFATGLTFCLRRRWLSVVVI